MPFSSLSDPNDLSRAAAALEAAWLQIRAVDPEVEETERVTLAYIVAGLVGVVDQNELAARSVEEYHRSAR